MEAEKISEKGDNRNANQIIYSKGEEWVNRISHLAGAALSAGGGAVIIYRAALKGIGTLGIVSVCLYTFSLLFMYIMSTLYHWMPVGKKSRAVFRRFDHCSISLLIAGTYAPLMLIGVMGESRPWAISLVSVVLGLAILSIVFNAINPNKFKIYSLISYVLMGWACMIRIDLLISVGNVFWFILAGGVVYTLGIIFYRVKKIPYNHALWHFFVLIASALHYFGILFFLIP